MIKFSKIIMQNIFIGREYVKPFYNTKSIYFLLCRNLNSKEFLYKFIYKNIYHLNLLNKTKDMYNLDNYSYTKINPLLSIFLKSNVNRKSVNPIFKYIIKPDNIKTYNTETI